MNPDYDWFDQKYKDGGKPSLKDKLDLFKQVFEEESITIPNRAKEKLERKLKNALYELRREYTESYHVIAHSILFCCSPLLKLDEQKYDEYLKQYGELMKRHQNKTSFNHNFNIE